MKSFYSGSEILRIFNFIWLIRINQNREKFILMSRTDGVKAIVNKKQLRNFRLA